jgi:hypothetical protein
MRFLQRLAASISLFALTLPAVALADVPVRSCCAIFEASAISRCFQLNDNLPGTPTQDQLAAARNAQEQTCKDVPLQYQDHQGGSAQWIKNDVNNSGVCGTASSVVCTTIRDQYSRTYFPLHAMCESVSNCPNQTSYLCQEGFCKLKDGQRCTGSEGSEANCADGLLCRSTPEGFKCLAPDADVSGSGGTAVGGFVSQEPAPFVPVVPKLGVPIPGFSFTSATEENGLVAVPYLSQYINAIYRYMTAIVLTVAIVMVMIGGFKYLLAASPLAVKDGKKTIIDAMIGMVLVLGAYVILNTVNPALIRLNTLQFSRVFGVEFELALDAPGFDEDAGGGASRRGGSSGGRGGAALNNPQYDNLFRAYAGCASVDYRVLKAVAFLESGYNPSAQNNKGFTGLFQVRDRTTNAGGSDTCSCLAGYGIQYEGRLMDPEINTMCGVMCHIKDAANTVRRRCPNMDANMTLRLIYFSHNSGSGALNHLFRVSREQGLDVCTASLQQMQDIETARVMTTRHCAPPKTIEECRTAYPNHDGRLMTSDRVASYGDMLGLRGQSAFSTSNPPCPLPR